MGKDTFVQDLIDENDMLIDRNDCLEEQNKNLIEENKLLKVEMETLRNDIEKLKSEFSGFEELIKDGSDVILKRLININGDSFNWIVNEACKRAERSKVTVEDDKTIVKKVRRRGYRRDESVDKESEDDILVFQSVPDRVLDYNIFEDRVLEESVSIVSRLAKMNKTDIQSMMRDFYSVDISDTI